MEYLTYILPLMAIAYVFYTAYGWMPLLRSERLPDAPPEDGLTAQEPPADAQAAPAPRPRFSFASKHGSISARDLRLMALITLLYAAVAFTFLGDRSAPESFCVFSENGAYADIELAETTEISRVDYYCGLNTGSYYLQYSEDGVNYRDVAVMEQKYSDLFKWKTAEYKENAVISARYIRLISDSELRLGELALYDAQGERLDADSMTCPAGSATLLDEQELAPVASSFMNSTYFDEIYHARTAYENIEGVYPYEISHPPLGKLILSLGIRLCGMNPFGWRLMGTLFGVLMLPALYIFLKRMFDSTSVAVCGTLVFAFDFMHFVQTRIATIDTYAVFFILLMYLFMWLWVSGGKTRNLILSGLFFGIGAASKWTCIYAGGGLAAIWLLHWISRRGEEEFWPKLAGNVILCLGCFVVLPCAIYYLSYIPYGEAKGMSGLSMLFSKDYADIVWKNQTYMFNYHSGLVATHPYSSRWFQWIVDGRPILYYLEYFPDGTRSAIGAFLNPLLCWSGLFAMIGTGILAFKKRDGRAMFILIGFLAQLLPWVFITRLTFEYHYFPSALFLAMALCYIWNETRERDYYHWKRGMEVFTALSLLLFVMFYPVLSGLRIPGGYSTYLLKWLPSWPF
ncbi:MAG: glycosyltransferase family 39 protein [Oscillospiraceae bacterium]